MTTTNYEAMSLDELRQYVLSHREDIVAFQAYIDRSSAAGRMISIDLNDNNWEENLTEQIQQSTSVEGESE
ncbi:MAG: hypothetical protein HXY43_20630 [Fischerella sp.]|jgi:hypothetical protein|uniref:DUF6887 family protein n=1 Tax=unclassified Fischerella TaxID=494603 RepID=UPI0004792520|nr:MULTISPECIES: hypothetical protein [unclassified Fischerella]NWF61586.1 hypothetical protein [Fischerella sp.]